MNRQGEVLLRHYVWGMLVFALFIAGGVTIIQSFVEENPAMVDGPAYETFNDSFNRIEEIGNSISTVQSGITDADTDFGAFGVLNALISAGWQSLRFMFTSLSVMNDAYMGLSTVFGVPAWVPGLIISAVVVLISFAIYSAIFQREI